VQVSGGYCGVMEAVSAGGASVPGSSVEGVLSPAAFPLQSPTGNGFLTHRTLTNDLPQRVVAFLRRCQAFVVMPGGLGTLTELCLTWDVSAVAAMRQQGEQSSSSERPLCLLLYRQPWEAVVTSLTSLLPIPASFLSRIRFVDGSNDVLKAVTEARAAYQADITTPPDRQQRGSEDEKC
jgi:predicted Rossmann-fold nucleotide-binding protein